MRAINIQRAYRNIFKGTNKKLHENAKDVLADLRHFCRTESSVQSDNPYALARVEGRREVIFYIMHKLNVDIEDIEDEEDDNELDL